MATSQDVYVASSPRRWEGAAGIAWSPAPAFELSVDWLGADQRDVSTAFLDAAAVQEGLVDGLYSGAHLELLDDTRDRRVAASSGHLGRIWVEEWFIQAGQGSTRTRVGASLTQLFSLGSTRVLALHAEGAWAGGDRAYLTSFPLGGADLLRGYSPGRFRGDAMAAAAAEFRRSLFSALSIAAFAEAGRVWAEGAPPGGTVFAADVGFSLRWGLPPDRLMKIRLDFARGRDAFTTYVAFGDAF
jgi:outer membrane translocation and assembly module TamA